MIRPYRATDEAAVLDIWYRASMLAHPFLGEDFLASEREEILRAHIPNAEMWVYETGEEILGFIALVGNEVGGIFVDPAHHGRGVGRTLMDHVRAGRDMLELDVFEANSSARRFYEAYGFTVVGRKLHAASGQPELRMRLAAPPDD